MAVFGALSITLSLSLINDTWQQFLLTHELYLAYLTVFI